MEAFFDYLCSHLHLAPWLILALFLLAGFNIPVSEDFLVIISGILASQWMPEKTLLLFTVVFIGSYVSDWEAYALGRYLAYRRDKKGKNSVWLSSPKAKRIKAIYSKYEDAALFLGRFIPFGVRNILFMLSGAKKMPFRRFLLIDGLACILSNIFMFTLAYKAGKNWQDLLELIRHSQIYVISFLALVIFITGVILLQKTPTGQKSIAS